MPKCPTIKKMDEIRAYGYDPERMERPDCLLHRLDLRLFPGFAGELQKYLGVKQYMPPSYLRASALLGRPIILSFWDHVYNTEVVDIREARLLHSMLSEDWEQADRAFVRDVDIHPALEPYRARYLQHCGRIYRGLETTMNILLRQEENDDHLHQRVHTPRQEVDGQS
jgi:hypothetical protein